MKLNYYCLAGLLLLMSLSLTAAGPKSEKNERKVTLYGNIGDSFTKVGVPKTFITLMRADSSVIDTLRVDSFSWATYKQESYYRFSVPAVPQQFIIHAQHPDYKDAYMNYEIKHVARNSYFEVPTLLMHRKDKKDDYSAMLNEVVVTATKVKMVYKGDTLVYNADAFNLPQGSMLDDLIKQLPGAKLKDNGEITVNGRKVDYLTLNGKDFFKGNNKMMLENMPYYTVKNIQVYNKTTEESKYLGQDNEKKDYVMDVQLKREYSRGYIANAEVAEGSEDRYLSRLFGLRFTDNSRLSIFGNANNVNESHSPGSEGNWESSNSPQNQRSVKTIGANVYIDDKDKRYTESLDAQMSWNGADSEDRTASETYLTSGNTYDRNRSMSRSRDYTFSVNNRFQLLKPLFFESSTSLSYNKRNNSSLSSSATFNSDPTDFGGTSEILDSVFHRISSSELGNITVNRTRSESMSDSKELTLEQRFYLVKRFSWGDFLSVNGNASYTDSRAHDYSLYRLDYLQTQLSPDFRNKYSSTTGKSYNYSFSGSYNIHLLSNWNFSFNYTYRQNRSDNSNPLYRLDRLTGWGAEDARALGLLPSTADSLDMCLDASNSSSQSALTRTNIGSFNIHYSAEKDSAYTYFSVSLPLSFKNENNHYVRGAVDTTFNRHYSLFMPTVQFYRWSSKGNYSYNFNYNVNVSTPSASNLVDVRDDSNPLSVRLGNPNLKNSITHYLYCGFNLNKPSRERFVSVSASGQLSQNEITNGYTYNSATGVYTYRPENINGNWQASASLNTGSALDKKKYLSVEHTTTGNYNHYVYLASEDGSTSTSACKMNSYSLSRSTSLKYQQKELTLRANVKFGWRHTGSGSAAAEATDIYTYDYGFTGQYMLPWKLQFATDITMFSRRGMSDSSMNTDDLVWNASVSRAFLRGKLICKFDAFDILHQLSQVTYNVSSGSMTSSWTNSIPRYVMLHLCYKINISPKKI